MNVETPVVTVKPVGQESSAPIAPEVPESAPKALGQGQDDPKSQESFSKRFSALNRERKALSAREAEMKKEMARIEAEKSELSKWKQQQQEIKEAKNPLKALEAFGYSYEDAAQYLLNDQRPTPDLMIKSVEEKVQALQAELDRERKAKAEYEAKMLEQESQKTNEQAIETIKGHLSKNPEFDALVALDMHTLVFDKINAHYGQTGEVLEIDDVAREMLKEVEDVIERVSKTTVFKKKVGNQIPQKTAPKTLSNQLHAQTTAPDKPRMKTDEERIRNALALLSK
jgi:DNA repair exonuclease SbcCD ATPase subunit